MCGEVYLELKLTFLRGVTRERYRSMAPKTRAIAHDMSYAAYRAWLHRQTTMPRDAGGTVEPGFELWSLARRTPPAGRFSREPA